MDTLFRAKRKDNGEWVYWNVFGQIVCDDGKTFNFVTYFGVNYWKIVDLIPLLIPETVGQWTGLTDNNGVKIFEGDIVKDIDTGMVKKIIYFGNAFIMDDTKGFYYFHFHTDEYKVIGNIHDNPVKGDAE